MLKTLFFIFLFYMLVKVVSRYFLQPKKQGGGNFRVFYQTFKNMREQQNQQEQHQQKNRTRNGNVKKDQLDDIEEAEYEDVTEENSEKQRN